MDVPASSARSQTSARSRISTTVVITLSGISLVASHRVETDARVASVSASASTTVKCVQTLPPIRHNSEGCGWKKKKRRSGEEEIKYEDEENKLHNHRRPLIRSVGVDSILARLACKMLYTHRNKCYSYLNHCLDHLSGLQVLRGAVRVRTCVAELHQQPPWQGALHRDCWCVSSRVSRVKLNPTQTVRVFYFGPRIENRFLACNIIQKT